MGLSIEDENLKQLRQRGETLLLCFFFTRWNPWKRKFSESGTSYTSHTLEQAKVDATNNPTRVSRLVFNARSDCMLRFSLMLPFLPNDQVDAAELRAISSRAKKVNTRAKRSTRPLRALKPEQENSVGLFVASTSICFTV